MIEVLRSTDPVRISFALALLKGAGCEAVLADRYMAAAEGGISAFPQRILVPDWCEEAARQALLDLDAPPVADEGGIVD